MKQANEPAFPEPFINDPDYALSIKPGLTKREYFAGLAMKGLLPLFRRYETNEIKGSAISMICGDAIVFADELLKQLEQ